MFKCVFAMTNADTHTSAHRNGLKISTLSLLLLVAFGKEIFLPVSEDLLSDPFSHPADEKVNRLCPRPQLGLPFPFPF